jgi:hypothetical protein
MGHSKRAKSLVSHRNFSGSGGKSVLKEAKLEEFTDKIAGKDKAQIGEYVTKYLIMALPDGSSKIVVYYCIKYGIQFIKDSQENDIEYALKNLAGTVVKNHLIPSVVDSTWDCIETNVIKENANKGLSRFAEEAFKETLSEIMTKGVDAVC